MFVSCSSDNDAFIEEEEVENTRYYVKYKLYMPNGGYSNTSQRITVLTENGEKVFENHTSEWEATYGPLTKDTKVYIKVVSIGAPANSKIESYIQIFVSREKEPFVLKGEQKTFSGAISDIEYTIDF